MVALIEESNGNDMLLYGLGSFHLHFKCMVCVTSSWGPVQGARILSIQGNVIMVEC